MRLIDADALTEDCKRYLGTLNPDRDGKECTRIHWLIGVLANASTIEPERKKGKWIDAVIPNDNGGLPVQVCDQCNTFFPLAYTGGGHSFCPNCGSYNGGKGDDWEDGK